MFRRKGFLDEIPHVPLIRGVVIGRTEDAGRAVRLLEEVGAGVHLRRIPSMREHRGAGQRGGAGLVILAGH